MSRNKETLIGAAVLAVLIVVFALKAMDRGIDRDGTGYPLLTSFREATGLTTGAEVRVAGIPVGVVASEDIDSRFRVRVTLRIRPDVRIPRDSAAVIETDGLLGAKYIELQPGGSDDMLQPGDTIEYSQDSVLFEDLLARIVSQAKAKLKAAEAATKPDGGAGTAPQGPDTPAAPAFPSLRDLLEEEERQNHDNGQEAPDGRDDAGYEDTRSNYPPAMSGRT